MQASLSSNLSDTPKADFPLMRLFSVSKFVCYRSELDPVTMWSDALGVLMTALEISRVSVMREAYLEAELLLNIGNHRDFSPSFYAV